MEYIPNMLLLAFRWLQTVQNIHLFGIIKHLQSVKTKTESDLNVPGRLYHTADCDAYKCKAILSLLGPFIGEKDVIKEIVLIFGTQ